MKYFGWPIYATSQDVHAATGICTDRLLIYINWGRPVWQICQGFTQKPYSMIPSIKIVISKMPKLTYHLDCWRGFWDWLQCYWIEKRNRFLWVSTTLYSILQLLHISISISVYLIKECNKKNLKMWTLVIFLKRTQLLFIRPLLKITHQSCELKTYFLLM